jgi:YD repeat-containing protein
MKYDIRLLTKAADALLATLTNPRHRAIIANYRKHAMLEVSGRYEEILAPDMTVEVPDYWLHFPDRSIQIVGMEGVRDLYKSLIDTDATVMWLEDEILAVADWGFSSEAVFRTLLPGRTVIERGGEADDLEAIYVETSMKSMQWRYDDRGRMIGEHVYSSVASYRLCPAEDILLRDEVRDILAPLIDRIPAPAALAA